MNRVTRFLGNAMPPSHFRQIGRHGSKSVTHKRNAEKGAIIPTRPQAPGRAVSQASFSVRKNPQRTHGPEPVLAGSELGG